MLAAHDRKTGGFVGWFAFFDDGIVDGLRTAEVGCRLIRGAWGRGLASEGVRALIDIAFRDCGFDRVKADTMAVNLGSRRVMEKCGMTHVLTYFPEFPELIPGAEQGEVIYEIRRPG